MESLFRYVASPTRCGYLPDRQWSLEYEYVGAMTSAEYLARMLDGWRRFGTMLFRPACPSCRACQSLRVPVDRFRPDRGMRRCRRANEGAVELRIGKPSVHRTKLALYDRYHAHQAEAKGWPQHPAKDAASYVESFVRHPFAAEEWCYYRDDRLIAVGYVDHLPGPPDPAQREAPGGQAGAPAKKQGGSRKKGERLALSPTPAPPPPASAPVGGLSAIYFFYEPAERDRSPGTWNILSLIDEARRRGLPYVYLGYYVEGCPSMSYKMRFVPNQIRGEDGLWRDFCP